MKITITGQVEATLINKLTWKKKIFKTKNTLVEWWEDYIARLLSYSHLLSTPFPVANTDFVDYMSIGAWYKLLVNSSVDAELYLPYDPVDGNEDADFYDWCTVYAISWPNQWESRTVASNWYNNVTRKITLTSGFSTVPLIGQVYVITWAVKEVQLNWEWESDENGNIILNPKQPVISKSMHISPLLNEVEIRAERLEAEWDYIVSEAGLWYNLASALPGQSSTQIHPWTLFARATFQNNPPHKTAVDILQVRWTIRVGVAR